MTILLLCIAVVLGLVVPGANIKVFPHRMLFERIDQWWLVTRLDYGPRIEARGRTSSAARPRSELTAAWTEGMVRPVSRSGVQDSYLADFMEGENATVMIAADPLTKYRVLLTVGDAEAPRGPMNIYIYDDLAVSSLETEPGEFVDVQFDVMAMGRRINVRFETEECCTFAVCGVSNFVLPGQDPVEPLRLYSAPDLDSSPRPLHGSAELGDEWALETLRTYCEFLLAMRPAEGCFSYSGYWYECAYPIRTLFAASELLGEEKYRDAALSCVDRFMAEREDDVGWGANFFGTQGCETAEATAGENTSRNLADVGSMTLALAVAAGEGDSPLRKSYLEALRQYADTVVLPAQLDSGAFPNLVFEGVEYLFPYSVATGIQAGNMAALYALTGEERYLQAATDAALFLAPRFRPDGKIIFCPHDASETKILSPDHMGPLFYILDGLLWVHRYADEATRVEIRAALDRFFLGPAIQELWANPARWFLLASTWEASKRSGLLYLITQYGALVNSEADVESMRYRVAEFLGNKSFAEWLGVLSEPGAPRSNFALVSTGFAGLGMVSLVAPEALYLDQTKD
jgi:hypothetical protein